MRFSVNFSVTASKLVLGAEASATRVRLKKSTDGAIMFMPTARKAVNNLPETELKARKLTRDARKGTLTVALNTDGVEPGVYVLAPGKHNWFTLERFVGEVRTLALPTVRISRKTG
jgi:hypothetical protein